MKRLAVLLLAAGLALLIPAGQAGAAAGTLTVGVGSLTGCFDPLLAAADGDRYAAALLYDTMIRPDGRGGFLPCAAQSWGISEDGRTVTFTLARGLVFSDGTAVTARDVVFSYRAAAAPGAQGPYGQYAASLLGYEAYHSGLTEDFPGVSAPDERTVVLRFTGDGRVNLADCALPILPAHGGQAVGSGPYVLAGRETGRVTLARSPTYRGQGYAIARIVLQAGAAEDLSRGLLDGSIDLLPSVEDPALLQAALDDPGLTANQYSADRLGVLVFNCERGAAADPAVRRALALAVDRESFYATCGGLTPAHSLLPPGSWAGDELLANALAPLAYDVERAADLLDEAGWPLNDQGERVKNGIALSVTLLCAAGQPHSLAMADLLARDWGERLGIRVTVEEIFPQVLVWRLESRSDAYAGAWQAALVSLSFRDGDPERMGCYVRAACVGDGLGNVSRYRSLEADRLLELGRTMGDPPTARPVYRDLAALLSRDVPMAPVYWQARYDLYTKDLCGLRTDTWQEWTAGLRDATLDDPS